MHVKELISYLIENAIRYDPNLRAPVRARVRRIIRRTWAQLYFIDLNSSDKILRLVVKWHIPFTAASNTYSISPFPDYHDSAACEGAALKHIQTFSPDSAFEPMKVYEIDTEKQLIIMERIDGKDLAKHFLSAHFFKARTAPQSLVVGFERSGAMLRMFHETMPDRPRCEPQD